MNKNLDLIELLKDCPVGTKFYSRCLGSVEFCKITLDNYIEVTSKNGCYIRFKPNGTYQHSEETAEIDLFPSKDQRDWNKWNRPFINGDIVFYNDTIAIFKEWGDETLFRTYITKYLCCDSLIDMNVPLFGKSIRKEIRFATEKEKQILFDAIKEYGYKWNEETKTLDKLIEPKFKVGDVIRSKNGLQAYKITNVTPEYYSTKVPEHEIAGLLPVKDQNDWILISNKFDPKTLQPFDKVLVRQYDVSVWGVDFYSYYDEVNGYAVCTGDVHYDHCIPYNEDTKHLVGKLKDAPEFYKYWEAR